MVVLMRLLRAEVTESHYQAWRVCAEYADQRWKLRTADGFLPGCAVFFGMLVPPQTQLDPLVRQSVLGPLGFTVNAVAPGFISTEMTRELEGGQREKIARRSALRRMAAPEDVAAAVEYLLSEKARNITGTTLTVDAGSTA